MSILSPYAPPILGLTCRPLAVTVGPLSNGEAFLVDRRVERSVPESSSPSEYVYFMRLPRVRPSYMENPGSGRVKAALRASLYSLRCRFCAEC